MDPISNYDEDLAPMRTPLTQRASTQRQKRSHNHHSAHAPYGSELKTLPPRPGWSAAGKTTTVDGCFPDPKRPVTSPTPRRLPFSTLERTVDRLSRVPPGPPPLSAKLRVRNPKKLRPDQTERLVGHLYDDSLEKQRIWAQKANSWYEGGAKPKTMNIDDWEDHVHRLYNESRDKQMETKKSLEAEYLAPILKPSPKITREQEKDILTRLYPSWDDYRDRSRELDEKYNPKRESVKRSDAAVEESVGRLSQRSEK